MAKKPLPPKRAPAAGGAAPPPPKQRSEAVGKFDKFAAFALAVPTGLLAIVALIFAVSYTSDNFSVGFFGFPGKSVTSYNSGPEAVTKLSGTAQITGFEQTGYIGQVAEGEMDVAVLNVGSNHNVSVGDVFTLTSGTSENVRLEFIVFDLQPNISRAYILLGQDVSEGKTREYSLKASDLERLCGGSSSVEVERTWANQIVRRYAEQRSNAG